LNKTDLELAKRKVGQYTPMPSNWDYRTCNRYSSGSVIIESQHHKSQVSQITKRRSESPFKEQSRSSIENQQPRQEDKFAFKSPMPQGDVMGPMTTGQRQDDDKVTSTEIMRAKVQARNDIVKEDKKVGRYQEAQVSDF